MDGILIIDKPAGWTSHDVVARVRRIINVRRVGHTGTLDPFATGVLVVLVGHATRLAQFLATDEKEYEAIARFGYATETGDLTGAPRPFSETQNECATWSDEAIEEALSQFRGEIEQVPPMYSAKKIGGRKLYEFARRGEEVERAPIRVCIRELEAVRGDGYLLHRNADGTCDLSLRVTCSAGTYIRTLAEQIGERLGAGAHLGQLRRTRAGRFRIGTAIALDDLQTAAEANRLPEVFISLEAGLSEMPLAHLSQLEAQAARHGATVAARESINLNEGEHLALYDTNGKLIGVAVYDAEGRLFRPRIVFPAEESESS